jgi:hypothetical protein
VTVPVTEFPEVAVATPDAMNLCACARNGKQDADAFTCKIFLLDKILLRAVSTALFYDLFKGKTCLHSPAISLISQKQKLQYHGKSSEIYQISHPIFLRKLENTSARSFGKELQEK